MKRQLDKFLVFIVFAFLIVKSCLGFQKIAWGTGHWLGGYSIKWGLVFLFYAGFCAGSVVLAALVIWRRGRFQFFFDRLSALREQMKNVRWLLVFFVLVLPLWFFQYTPWGVVFKDIYLRILAWFLIVLALAFLFKKGKDVLGWGEIFFAVILTSSLFVLAVPFMNVTDYPFSLGWSEGNRMWDYSVLFGRRLYDYPDDREIFVLLDIGRQFIGGLPFLLPKVTIEFERFWIALTVTIPYLLLGLVTFRFMSKDKMAWAMVTLWTLVFLKQGPIHPPLVFCALAVALLWGKPLWLALPLIILTGYAAEQSRFTWLFAPGIWIGVLELAGVNLEAEKAARNVWVRASLLGLAGVFGGFFGPKIAEVFNWNREVPVNITDLGGIVAKQPLLWYRLFPNATYGTGILFGLLIASLPVVLLLLYLAVNKKWILNKWQSLAVIMSLLAFLSVGVIVSTKIGGGGDLHNMDMLLIGLMFTVAIAWKHSGGIRNENVGSLPVWIKIVLILGLGLPGLQFLAQMRSNNFPEDAPWLVILTDAPSKKALDMLPSKSATNEALNAIQNEVSLAVSRGGEVLFMDQRQLLTFGYIQDVPLVAEYEKKLLMDEALSSNSVYFKGFYSDISRHRFSLIISELLRTPVKDDSYQFGEENNAWVKWVSNPILCYYEPKMTLKEVGVQLLVPKKQQLDCSIQLP